MAAIENIKSLGITDLDTFPPLMATAAILQQIDGFAALTGTNSSAGSTYQLCRFPSNALVKSVKLWLDEAGTTIIGHCGLTFSTSLTEGTNIGDQPLSFGGPPLYANTIAPGSPGSAESWFTNALDLSAVTTPTEYSTQAANHLGAGVNFSLGPRDQPMWQNLGLGDETAGYLHDLDLTFTLSSTAGSPAVINASVEYVLDATPQ